MHFDIVLINSMVVINNSLKLDKTNHVDVPIL